MTRKDFRAIAETIKNLDVNERNRLHIANSFANMLKHTNPRFDRERFLKACAASGENIKYS